MDKSFRLKKEWPYILFIIPAFVAYTVFGIYPLFSSFKYAFTNWDGFNKAEFVGLSNFVTAFSDGPMLQALTNTLIYAVSVTVLVTIFAIPLAIILNSEMKSKNLQRAIFFFPSVPSALILGYLWSYMLSPTNKGLINRILSKFDISTVLWLARPNLAMFSLIMVTIWATTGWHACIYLANLQSIPKEYYESAQIDGAKRFDLFKHITFPMLAPAMTISVMLLITSSLKVFDLVFSLTNGGPGYSTTMITQIIITRGITEKMYGKATAMSVIFFIIIFIVTTLQLTLMKKREEKLI